MKLFNGDCLEIMKDIPDNSIDFILTDLPYGMTQSNWDTVIPFKEMWKEIKRIRKDNTAIALFGTEPFSSNLRLSNINEYKYDWIWDKVKKSNFLNAKRQPLRSHELISIFYKKQCTYNPQKTTGHKRAKVTRNFNDKNYDQYSKLSGRSTYNSTERYPHSIITFDKNSRQKSLHPTQKPVALLKYLIRTYTAENETVLDFTMGSGSTGVAALTANRNFIGIELENKYFEIARKRIESIQQ